MWHGLLRETTPKACSSVCCAVLCYAVRWRRSLPLRTHFFAIVGVCGRPFCITQNNATLQDRVITIKPTTKADLYVRPTPLWFHVSAIAAAVLALPGTVMMVHPSCVIRWRALSRPPKVGTRAARLPDCALRVRCVVVLANVGGGGARSSPSPPLHASPPNGSCATHHAPPCEPTRSLWFCGIPAGSVALSFDNLARVLH